MIQPENDPRAKLADLAGYSFAFTCPGCQHTSTTTATQLMIQRGGAAKLVDIARQMKCTECGRLGAPDMEITR